MSSLISSKRAHFSSLKLFSLEREKGKTRKKGKKINGENVNNRGSRWKARYTYTRIQLAVVNRRGTGTVGDARLCARETEGKVSRIERDR